MTYTHLAGDWPRRAALACAAMLAACAYGAEANAQSWMTDVQLSVATGLEGADTGIGLGWQRARTRVVLGFDMGNDETGYEGYGARAFVELERGVSVGAELGYLRWIVPEVGLFFGGVAVLAPETLYGGTAAITFVIPLGKRVGIPIWGSLNVLPLGSDRPNDGVVLWALAGLGIRGRL